MEKAIASMWGTLPKNPQGNVQWRSLRYLAHRFFLSRSGLLVRGLEPRRQLNDSQLGQAHVLEEEASPIEAVLRDIHTSDAFSMQDAVLLMAALEELIHASESDVLVEAYTIAGLDPNSAIMRFELQELLGVYLLRWVLSSHDVRVVKSLLLNKRLIYNVIPIWDELSEFVAGQVKALLFSRRHTPVPGRMHLAMGDRFFFQDVHEIVGLITRTFAHFWDTECQSIKHRLVKLDRTATGRVPVSAFYGANVDGEWRFQESEAYLQDLGALDVSPHWEEKQVIIPNYLQGMSNCIVHKPHYAVCCMNECESIINEIEAAIDGPTAEPAQLVSLVANITGLNDEPAKVPRKLRAQLERTASQTGGIVPLHGRVFAQWLHYVFPHDCPFPHKAGSASFASPMEFGDDYIVNKSHISRHVEAISRRKMEEDLSSGSNASASEIAAINEEQHMYMWSEDEELYADYSNTLTAGWDTIALSGTVAFGLACAAMLVLVFSVMLRVVEAIGGSGRGIWGERGFPAKANFV